MAKEVRGPVEQLLSVAVPGFEPTGRRSIPSLAPTSSPASSIIWPTSVAFGPPRCSATATTSTA